MLLGQGSQPQGMYQIYESAEIDQFIPVSLIEQDNIIKLMPIKFYPFEIHCGWLEMSAFLNVSFNLEL